MPSDGPWSVPSDGPWSVPSDGPWSFSCMTPVLIVNARQDSIPLCVFSVANEGAGVHSTGCEGAGVHSIGCEEAGVHSTGCEEAGVHTTGCEGGWEWCSVASQECSSATIQSGSSIRCKGRGRLLGEDGEEATLIPIDEPFSNDMVDLD